VYLAFGLNGQLTHLELHALANGRFGAQFFSEAFPKSKAVFAIRRSSSGAGRDFIVLEPK
jgi:hypothetical protein